MKKTKITSALMIITAGSALLSANIAGAEEVEASRHHHGHFSPPPREWRRGPEHHNHMPPHEFDRGPRHMGFHEGPGRDFPPHRHHRGPGHFPPTPPPERGCPPRW